MSLAPRRPLIWACGAAHELPRGHMVRGSKRKVAAGRHSAERHAGIVYTAMYWHFLDGMWLVIFITLLIGT